MLGALCIFGMMKIQGTESKSGILTLHDVVKNSSNQLFSLEKEGMKYNGSGSGQYGDVFL